MVCTRLDIDYAVWIVSKFLSNSSRQHCPVVKWIFPEVPKRYDKSVYIMMNLNHYSIILMIQNWVEIWILRNPPYGISCFMHEEQFHKSLPRSVSISTTKAKYIVFLEAEKENVDKEVFWRNWFWAIKVCIVF